MPEDMTQVYSALQKADAAGDKASAAKLATYIRSRSGKQVAGGGRRVVQGEHGRRLPVERDYPALPFMHRTAIGMMDKEEEQNDYLTERGFPGSSISKDKRGRVLTTADGKKMRVNVGLAAEITAQSPELILGGIGALTGAAGGPVTSVMGAVAGGAAGKALKEAGKSVMGVQRQSPGEILESTATAGAAMGTAEGAGKALGTLRKLPVREKLFDITSSVKAQTKEAIAAGARPPVQSTMPSAMKFQRASLFANKMSGPNKNIDRANFGYVQDKVRKLLRDHKIGEDVGDTLLQRLVQGNSESAPSFRGIGLSIQNTAKYLESQAKGAKAKAYMKQLSSPYLTPEKAFEKVTRPGEEDLLIRTIDTFGKNSIPVQNIQMGALKRILAGVMQKAESKTAFGAIESKEVEGVNVIEATLNEYTPTQQKLLFPNGLDRDLRTVGRAIQFVMPKPKDPGMAGMATGAIMDRIWYNRFYAQWTYSFSRAMLQDPSIIRRLAIGLNNTATRQATKAIIKDMGYFGVLEMQNPGQDPDEHPQARAAAPK